MKAIVTILSTVSALINLPIWLYALHYILATIDASDLVWFLYWIYVPVIVLGRFLAFMLEKEAAKP